MVNLAEEKDVLDAELHNLMIQCQICLNALKKPISYEYRHIANNQFSKLKDSIVELMNEGWEEHGGMTRNSDGEFPTEYSQIMRRVK